MFDKEVTHQQIQSLNDIEAITAFFAYLGYDTNSRIQQTPANLGITSETIQRQIKRIERIADQQGCISLHVTHEFPESRSPFHSKNRGCFPGIGGA